MLTNYRESSTYPFTILHVEANFLRDFSCCGLTLPSLHDLLQHNEEEHTETQKSSHEIIPVMEIDDLQMYNNPSASAVDTTTREFHDIQDQVTPDSSIPPTPTDLDDLAKNIIQRIADDMWNNPFDYNYGAFDNHNHMLHLCIDEPTKSLCTILDSSQDGPNSKSGEQQVLPDTNTGLTSHDESKPWGCPVIGCEKAYKNLNGLKYHQSVSLMSIHTILVPNKFCSMVTKTSSYTIMETAHSQL